MSGKNVKEMPGRNLMTEKKKMKTTRMRRL